MNMKLDKREAEEKYRHTGWVVFKNKVVNILSRFTIMPRIRIYLYRIMGVNIGRNVFIGMDSYIDDQIPELITIEDGVIIAFRVTIVAHDDSDHSAAPIVIKKNAYIGTGAIVLEGVTIGENAVIGAGAVVTSDIPPNTVAAGVPCKVIKARNIGQTRIDERRG